MTDQQVVEEAKALCEELLKSTWEPSPLSRVSRTHLAEFDEHYSADLAHSGEEYCCACTELAPSWVKYPCRPIITKAKRILGRDN